MDNLINATKQVKMTALMEQMKKLGGEIAMMSAQRASFAQTNTYISINELDKKKRQLGKLQREYRKLKYGF